MEDLLSWPSVENESGPSDQSHSPSESDSIDSTELDALLNAANATGAGVQTRGLLTEQENLIRSVNWLGRHVPVCVLNRLGKEIASDDDDDDDEEEHSIRRESSAESRVSDLSDDEGNDHSEDEFISQPELGVLSSLKEEEEADSRAEDASIALDGENTIKRQNSSSSGGKKRRESENLDLSSSIEFDINEEMRIENGASPEVGVDVSSKRLSSKLEKEKLPYASKHDCALLYVDISGFTRLSKLLDPESLSEAINSYFHLIANEVTMLGGDILKFAGDALFAEWQAVTDAPEKECKSKGIPNSVDPAIKMSLPECVATAASCGASIVSKCSDFPVFARKGHGASRTGRTAQVATLNVHCGLGVGRVVGVHVGDNESRREFLVLGDPIKQSTEAANDAALGEFFASPEAVAVMSETCDVDENTLFKSEGKPVLIATKSSASFRLRRPRMQRRCSVTSLCEGWTTDMLQKYRKLISLYVHPVVVNNDLAASKNPRRNSTIKERHTEEAELRSVYVMFIRMTRVRARISDNAKEDLRLFRLLNDIMELTTRELKRFKGHLRQFIVDDKGLVLIATFGLRGSTFPNMVTERALPATTVIHNALQSELGVHNRIGATLGNAYCGFVGGAKRHEFAVLGPSVNLAARLMTNESNPGILVDDAIRLNAGKSYGFNALDPVEAKGFSLPMPIFEPLSSIDRRWGKVKSFVGRKTEIKKLVSIAKEASSSGTAAAKMVFVTAESGTGKSSMVAHAIAHIRKVVGRKKKRVLISKHVCRESDRLVPFSMLRSILPDVLDDMGAWKDDSSVATSSSKTSVSGMTWASANDSEAGIQWDGLSVASSVTSSPGASPDRLIHVCRELNAPPEFLELVGHHLLGMDRAEVDLAYQERSPCKPPSLQGMVNLMAQACQMCTRRASLVVIALDDVHQMDEMSWKVLSKLFVTSRNLLIICTSQPFSKYKLTIEQGFWQALNTKYKEQHRFIPMNLRSLGERDIKSFLARELGVKEDSISERFHQDVFKQSGGMPHFVNEILQDLKRRNNVGMDAGNLLGWRVSSERKGEIAPSSLGELIVHRVDSFDPVVRNVLNLGAVLGDSFKLLEIVSVLQELNGATRSQEVDHAENTVKALEFLVDEGILRQVVEGGEDELFLGGNVSFGVQLAEKEGSPATLHTHRRTNSFIKKMENREYTFCNDLWRASILKLMLDSRKKDIHRTIAITLEAQQVEDYESKIMLFGHWKAGGNFSKAAGLALWLGTSFEKLGLHHQSIQLYEDTLAMWKGTDQCRETVGGFSAQLLGSIGVSDLEFSVKLHIALGHCLANIHKASESVTAYQNALEILQAAPAAKDVADRSIAFPLFSGLFAALRFGTIEQDKDCSYEQDLVRRFVNETRLNGDPVHFSRALAMQAEMHARLGNFHEALEIHRELESVYSVDEHSASICKEYGSDWCAQSFGAKALWLMEQGNTEDALRASRFVIGELMPKMEVRNVHNSFIVLYPVLWVMWANGFASEMRDTFEKNLVGPFHNFFGDGAFTFYLPVYDPIMMLLDLTVRQNTISEQYLHWALNEDNIRLGAVLNNTTGNLGMCCDAISAEICFLLAKRVDETGKKIALVRNGVAVARECVELAESKGMSIALQQAKAILDGLDQLASKMLIDI